MLLHLSESSGYQHRWILENSWYRWICAHQPIHHCAVYLYLPFKLSPGNITYQFRTLISFCYFAIPLFTSTGGSSFAISVLFLRRWFKFQRYIISPEMDFILFLLRVKILIFFLVLAIYRLMKDLIQVFRYLTISPYIWWIYWL